MAALITLTEYKEYHTVTTATDNTKLTKLIDATSALVENYCGRKFGAGSYTEFHDAKQSKVYLENFPVNSLTYVKVSADGGTTQTTLTEAPADGTGYYVDLPNETIMTQTGSNFLSYYNTPFHSLEIAYNAGYSQIGDIPKDLKLVTMDLVNYYKNDEHKPSMIIGAASTDNPLPFAGSSFPAHIRRVLDLYRFAP
jgi:hypothetical protein